MEQLGSRRKKRKAYGIVNKPGGYGIDGDRPKTYVVKIKEGEGEEEEREEEEDQEGEYEDGVEEEDDTIDIIIIITEG